MQWTGHAGGDEVLRQIRKKIEFAGRCENAVRNLIRFNRRWLAERQYQLPGRTSGKYWSPRAIRKTRKALDRANRLLNAGNNDLVAAAGMLVGILHAFREHGAQEWQQQVLHNQQDAVMGAMSSLNYEEEVVKEWMQELVKRSR